ncbi:MAG TPA: SLC13 family permease, partial [Deltaproteobacteria bacterium]|nr:SLC13 family permease [Deltaproteobacteria bacterium]
NRLVGPILRIAGNSKSRVIIAISVTVAGISSFMQNIGAAALFLPAIQRISKNMKIPLSQLLMPIGFSAILGGTVTLVGCSPLILLIPLSQLLMPIGFSAILGGTVTLVGCSPLILLNDLLAPFGLKPFGLFDVTPIGLALVASGIGCFIVLGRFILPKGSADDAEEKPRSSLENTLKEMGETYEIRIPDDFTDYREPVLVDDLRRRYLVNVLAMTEPPDFKTLSPTGDQAVRSGVHLLVYGRKKDVQRMVEEEEMHLKEAPKIFKGETEEGASGTVEAVVAPRSPLAGKTLREINLRDRFQVVPLAVYRGDETYRAEIGDIVLSVGDAVLIHGEWQRLQVLQQEKSLLFTTPVDVELLRPEKAIFAGIWLAVALSMVLIFKIQLSVSLMTGALGMIITRVLSIDEAYQSVDWRTIFLLAGLIPLGIATEKTGTAAWIAHAILHTIGDVQPIVLLTVIGILSTIFTLVISNVGATVLLVPLVVNMAIAAHTDPRMAALVVGLATSNSFMLPTHQVNALYMGPGRYRSVDFMKAGGVISIVFIVVMIGMIKLVYGV